jgi:hypothetical protein
MYTQDCISKFGAGKAWMAASPANRRRALVAALTAARAKHGGGALDARAIAG